jgi:uncharacterized protein
MIKLTLKAALLLAGLAVPAIAEVKIGFEQKALLKPCPGRDLFADLRKSDPGAAQQVLSKAAEVKNAGPLLWEITATNGAAPSYLLGTIHVTDPAINDLPDALKKTLKGSKVLALELKEIANKQSLQAQMLDRTDKVFLPDGKTLWDITPDDLEAKIRNHPELKNYPAVALEKLRPWVIGMMLNKPDCESTRAQSLFMLDQTLAFLAQIANVPVAGLETVDEQVNVFSGFSEQEEVELLALNIEPKIPGEDQLATIVSLYKSRQVTVVEPLMKHLDPDPKSQEIATKLVAALLGQRNVNMANRAGPYIDKGKAFIAVGAAHLAGENGVVELLRKKGYGLKPIKY